MSFAATISNALSGLNASTTRAELLSFNIANSGTDNYARRTLRLEAVDPGGVRIQGVDRADEGSSGTLLLRAETDLASADARAGVLRQINTLFGEIGDDNGLYAVYSRFEEALEDLRLSPESGSAQNAFLTAASDLAATFADLDAEAQRLRLEADQEIARTTDQVNAALRELEALNGEVRKPLGIGVDTGAERQRALVLEISQALDIEVAGRYGEPLQIRTKGGLLLLGETAQELSFTPTGTIDFSTTFAGGALSGLSLGGQDISPGTLQGITGGSLAGQFAVRDALGTDFATRLDAAAQDLVDRTAAADTTSPDGLFILNPGTSSAATRLVVNPAVDPAQGGELYRLRDGVGAATPGPEAAQGILGDLKDELADARVLTAATGSASALSFVDTLGAMATQFGVSALRAEGRREAEAATRDSFADEIARITGVDTDRELQELLLVEQAFAANARVLEATDAMLNQLLEL